MFFHLLLTTNCDLKCRYCYGKSCGDMDADFGDFEVDYSVPDRITYDIELLEKFIGKDPEPVLIFYGGEPMLYNDKIKQIMDKVKAKQFNVQTNGLHLNRLEPEYLNRLSTIFVSIDGTEKLTDYYRGKGVYRKAIENVKNIRKNGFKGEIVDRMTLMEETDIYENVMWLLNNPDYQFSSVHWQLDAGFWKNDFHKRPFAEWVEENYNPQIRRLVEFWVNTMEMEGKVLRLSVSGGNAITSHRRRKPPKVRFRMGELQHTNGWQHNTMSRHEWNERLLRRTYPRFSSSAPQKSICRASLH